MSVPSERHDVGRDLDIAHSLIRAGVPVFVAKFAGWGNGTSGSGFVFPKYWPLTEAHETALRGFEPGDALGAVMGQGLDLLDIDPRNGGDASRAQLVAAGQWPRAYGSATTPSGGRHEFIAPLGVGSRDGFAPGLDHKGGRHGVPVLDAGRGFAFIAPTVKPSKVTAELVPYVWDQVPDFDLIAEGLEPDAAALDLAELIRQAKATKTARPADPSAPAESYLDPKHSGPIPDGQRHAALIAYAGKLRGRGLSLAEAERLMWGRWQDCAQPENPVNPARFPLSWEEAVEKLRDVFARFAAEPVRGVGELAPPPGLAAVLPLRADDDPEAARIEAELAFNRAVAERVYTLRVSDEATRLYRAEAMPVAPEPVGLDLLLAEEPERIAWRIESVFPINARVVLAAQRKAGKTTMTANLARCLVDGGLFLDRWPVAPVERRVTVLDFEMSRNMLRDWLTAQAIVNAEKLTVWPLRGSAAAFDITTSAVRRQWATRLAELGTDVLIVDCLRPILDAIGLDESREAGRFLVALDELAADAGIGEMVLVHHAGHQGERSRGDSRLRDWPDAEWRLVREKAEQEGEEPGPDAKRFFMAEGRDVAVPESALDYNPATRRLTLVGGNRQASKAETHFPRIIELIREGMTGGAVEGAPGYTGAQIEALMKGDAPRAAVRQALGLLSEKGQIITVPGGRTARFYLLAGPIQLAQPAAQGSA